MSTKHRLVLGVDAEKLAQAAYAAASAMHELGVQIALAEAERELPIIPQYHRIKDMDFYVERKPEPWQRKGKRYKGRR
ncbi:TPA: hypothetical protein NNT57_004640 [Salmonella enterica]|nr:hypothetical protein [Salmonella enterica]HCH9143096.1 hypothetical protein [Salmonella enterica]